MTVDVATIARRVATRCGVTEQSALWTSGQIREAVSDALIEFSHWPVNVIWPWLYRDVAATLAAGESELTFAALGLLVVDNAEGSGNAYPVTRIIDVGVDLADGSLQPIRRLSRVEMRNYNAGSWLMPSAWTAERNTLIFTPAATSDTDLSIRLAIDEQPAGDNDGMIPLLPERYHAPWIMLARSIVYEMKQDDARADTARKHYAEQARQALWHSRQPGGVGRVPLMET